MIKETIKSLRGKCQNTHHNWNEQPWLFLLIRRISIYFTWAFLQTPLRPNAITVLALIVSILAAAALVANALILSVVLIQITIILDFTDGEVSRYRGQTSKEGSYLDKVYIFLVHPVLMAGLAIYEIQKTGSLVVIVTGFICVIGVFAYSMVIDYAKQIVVWKHFHRYLFDTDLAAKQQSADIALMNKTETDQQLEGSDTIPAKSFRERIKNMVKGFIEMGDFPYVFMIMSIVIIAEFLISSGYLAFIEFSPAKLFLYFFATMYPLIICAFLFKNLHQSQVENDYNLVVEKFETMINQHLKNRS